MLMTTMMSGASEGASDADFGLSDTQLNELMQQYPSDPPIAEAEVTSDLETPRILFADDSVKSLGFTLAGEPPETVMVKRVTSDSWAAAQDLVPGTRLIRVNGELASSMSGQDLKGKLRQRPIQMEVLPPPEDFDSVMLAKPSL